VVASCGTFRYPHCKLLQDWLQRGVQWMTAAYSLTDLKIGIHTAIFTVVKQWTVTLVGGGGVNFLNRYDKAFLLQAWTGPRGSWRLRLQNFWTIGTWRW
jgi:hypothetical protein